VPFLHVAGSNTAAIRLYLALGFTERRPVIFSAVRVPEDVTGVAPDPAS
jgi:ribosomal protein S18 acetylase RimI-like enzyme